MACPGRFGVAGRRSAGAGPLSRGFLSKGEETAPRSPATSPRDAGRPLPSRDGLNRQPARDESVSHCRRGRMDVSVRPRPQSAEGSRHRGIHGSQPQPDYPSYARARVGPARPQDLQRLLVCRAATSPWPASNRPLLCFSSVAVVANPLRSVPAHLIYEDVDRHHRPMDLHSLGCSNHHDKRVRSPGRQMRRMCE
jgi:hypothetical protein